MSRSRSLTWHRHRRIPDEIELLQFPHQDVPSDSQLETVKVQSKSSLHQLRCQLSPASEERSLLLSRIFKRPGILVIKMIVLYLTHYVTLELLTQTMDYRTMLGRKMGLDADLGGVLRVIAPEKVE